MCMRLYLCACVYVLLHIMYQCTKLTSTGDDPCQYNTDGSNNKEFHYCLSSGNLLPQD